jgi:hypothetical protein
MAQELEPLINGREYGWGDIFFNIGALPVTGITAIKYEEEQEKEEVYGAGRNPVSRAYGRIKTSGSISLLASTLMAIKSAAPKKQLHRIAPFSITVTYQPDDGPIVIHVLKNCEFKKTTTEWKGSDSHKEITLDLLISHIVEK